MSEKFLMGRKTNNQSIFGLSPHFKVEWDMKEDQQESTVREYGFKSFSSLVNLTIFWLRDRCCAILKYRAFIFKKQIIFH